ncbi:cbb3-type cytochrome c oxidase subunit I [Acidiphilium acidophilum]|uniref:cbb3-type cytochrome c oxidase subunit I n=1 Tax=Acidiphilium acidophilum TaxID=76588 RepID=UPI002E8E613F|nr:cbb3-type cytochrome c oxidase subunit I [Acidiphilium acidophilum]
MSVVIGAEREAAPAMAWAAQKRLMSLFLIAGFSALMIGAAIGPLQALNYADVNAYPFLRPVLESYYEGLTIHGVLNAYVFTFFVTSGLLVYLPARELELEPNMPIWWTSFGLMAIGAVMLLYAMFDNSSSVLWTFYPPLKGSPYFYFGMTLLTLGSMVPLAGVMDLRTRWKRANPGKGTPLVTYMSAATLLMWLLAALGAAAELIIELDPWSLGLTKHVDPIIGRTLFWWTGHPIVYFWLMPAYVSWYAFLPREAGGKLVSDPMARLTFALLLVFSMPVGTHHQLQDPGIAPVIKAIIAGLTLSVALPSLITAFTLGLSLEYAGRRRGGRGWIGWFTALPWKNPSVAAQVLAMITFIFGGAGGIVNGSFQLDNIVHNTTWIPGHFHITVGTAVTMTFMGLSFWMIPHLTGRALFSRKLALISIWLWFIGMSVFSLGMHWAGLFGVPRRAWVSELPHSEYTHVYGVAHFPLILVGVGGVILWGATAAFYVVFFGSLFGGKRNETPVHIPFTEFLAGPEGSRLAAILEYLWPITGLTFLVTIAAYLPVLIPFFQHQTFAPGWMVW